MTKIQMILGWCYVPVHILVLPILLSLYAAYAETVPDTLTVNIVYYGVSTAFVLVFMLKYLRVDFDTLLDRPGQAILSILMAYLINLILSYAVVLALDMLLTAINNPNNAVVADLAQDNTGSVFGLAVLIGPIVEETLFRGVVFGSIRRKSRIAAYAVSMALFAVYHIWQYVVAAGDVSLFIYSLQYLPIGFALAWAYERSGSIWTSIFLHMGLNAMAIYAMNTLASL